MKTNKIISYFGGFSATAKRFGMTVKDVCSLPAEAPKEFSDKAIELSNGKINSQEK